MIDMKAIFGDVKYKLTSPFGYRSPLGLPAGASKFHQGIDWSVPAGTKIGAFESGKVLDTGFNKAKGNFVRIQHSSGLVSEYGHLDSVAVRSGQTLSKGGLLGFAGNTGISSGVHLDFRLSKDGNYFDPLKYGGEAGGSTVDVGGITDLIKDNWYFIAGGLLIVAVLSK